MYLILRWIVSAASLVLVSYLVPGVVVASTYSALIAALILGFVNAIIRPILILLTLPITLLTLGLFTLVINALMLWFVASIVDGFAIESFSAAFWASLILWLVGWITNSLLDTSPTQPKARQ